MSAGPTAALGIDIGTTGVRLSLVTPGGGGKDSARSLEASASLTGSHREGDRHEQEPAEWWRAFEACLVQLASRTNLESVESLAIDGTSGTILLCDAAGEPQTPGLMYDDRRAGSEANLLGRFLGPGEMAHTAASPLAKALWLLRHHREKLAGKFLLAHQADWLAGKITGRFGFTDENNALKTGYDPDARAWLSWIGQAGFPAAALPIVRPVGTTLGTVNTDFARQYGFSPKCRVVLGTTDSIAAFLATDAEKTGDAATSWGTTLAIKMLVDRPVVDNASGVYSHRLGERWLVGGASNVGGAILLEHFKPGEIDPLCALIDPDRPTGCAFYPLIKPGERFPIYDPNLQPRLEPRPAARHLFLQAILEGMAEVERLAYARLRALTGVAPEVIYSTGGVTRNRVFNSIRARVIRKRIVMAEHGDAAYGMAKLALQSPA